MKGNTLSRLLSIVIPLYFTQGFFFGHGSLVSQILILLWLIVDIYYTALYYIQGQRRDPMGSIFLLFWFMIAIYWLISPKEVITDHHEIIPTYGDLKNISVVILSYFPFKKWCEDGICDQKYLKFFSVLLLLSFCIAFYVRNIENLSHYSVDHVTNNAAYYFPVLFPLLGVFFKQKKIYLFIILMVAMVLFGAKRGAIICLGIELILFFYFRLKNTNQSKSVPRKVGILIAIVLIGALANNIYENYDFLQMRLVSTREGNYSDRDYLYSAIWNAYENSSIFNIIFGFGFDQSVTVSGGFAHQDWLELLICHGIVGIAIYTIIFIRLFKFFFLYKCSSNQEVKFIYLSAITSWFIRSMFSMGYPSIETSVCIIAIAYSQTQLSQSNIMKKDIVYDLE